MDPTGVSMARGTGSVKGGASGWAARRVMGGAGRGGPPVSRAVLDRPAYSLAPSPILSCRPDAVRMDVEPAAPQVQQLTVAAQESPGLAAIIGRGWLLLRISKGELHHG